MTSACPFARLVGSKGGKCPVAHSPSVIGDCPVGKDSEKPLRSKNDGSDAEPAQKADNGSRVEEKGRNEGMEPSTTTSAKCPLGYDASTFKIGPLSCVICRALLFDSVKCVPCRHIFCRGCVSRFNDCPLCGADILSFKPDSEMQSLVERFIRGHARLRPAAPSPQHGSEMAKNVHLAARAYQGDVEGVNGSFLLQQAMRAFMAQNYQSAKERLEMCLEDTREELRETDATATPEAACRLGAVLGSLGDCCRAMGDMQQAAAHYEESAEFLSGVKHKDQEVVHALSVSLNKLGDLRYYAQDLPGARECYNRALTTRQDALSAAELSATPSQVLDVAVSLAKVADVDRAMGDEDAAMRGFKEVGDLIRRKIPDGSSLDPAIEQRRATMLEFVESQSMPAHA